MRVLFNYEELGILGRGGDGGGGDGGGSCAATTDTALAACELAGVAATAACNRATMNTSPNICAAVGAVVASQCNNTFGVVADTTAVAYSGGAIDDGARG